VWYWISGDEERVSLKGKEFLDVKADPVITFQIKVRLNITGPYTFAYVEAT